MLSMKKPVATVTVEPTGARASIPRAHTIKVLLNMIAGGSRHGEKIYVEAVARKVLDRFPPADGEPDRRRVIEMCVRGRPGKGGMLSSVVVGMEGSAEWHGRPGDDPVEELRETLLGEGYRVAVRERRECAEPACRVDVLIDWNRPSEIPAGWYSNRVCGGHNYRTCARCKSLYALSSTNAAGQAPAVHCEVCGQVLIEWGSSKVWIAQLVAKA